MKKYITILLASAMLVTTTSCDDFFENNPKTSLTQEQVFKDLAKMELSVDGLFLGWRDLKKDRQGLMFLLGLDETQQGAYQVMTDNDQAGLDKYNTALSADNKALTTEWDNRWKIMAQANIIANAIERVDDGGIQEVKDKIDVLLGQTYFIRAVLHFEVAQYWGEIPVLAKPVIEDADMGRQPLEDVYTQIIQDLQKAADLLPDSQEDKRRVTKGAAQTMLGKTYMSAPVSTNLRDFAKAAEVLKKVVDNPKYKLVNNFADLFDASKENTQESIYEFQFNNIQPDQNQIQWQTGSRALANLESTCYFGGYDLIIPTKYCHSDVASGGVWEDGDLRRSESIRYDFTYKGVVPKLESSFGGDELDPHIKKYEDIRVDGETTFWLSGKNVHYLRFADALLCYAECLNEQGQTASAVAIVNDKIRTRAWGGTLPNDKKWNTGMSQGEFRTKIMDERMRELCFEGWRRVDLIRTGKFVEYIKGRNKWAKDQGAIKEHHMRYPIPRTEIMENNYISDKDQNPGYN